VDRFVPLTVPESYTFLRILITAINARGSRRHWFVWGATTEHVLLRLNEFLGQLGPKVDYDPRGSSLPFVTIFKHEL
jgi:hypothetical protein